MIGLTLTGVACILSYIFFSIKRFGIPPSISETHYLWSDSGIFVGRHLFTLTMWAVSFLCLPFLVGVSSESTEFLAFLSFAALVFVGTACEFKERVTKAWHYVSAIVWAVCGIAWCVLNAGPFCLIAAVPGIIATFINLKNKTFWLEVACISVILFSIIILI